MLNRLRTAIAVFLAFVFMAALPLEAATKKKQTTAKKKPTTSSAKKTTAKKSTSRKSSGRKRAPVAPPVARATGTTLEQRLASLMNSAIPAASETSLKVVEVETGRVVGERNGNMPVAPASNLKLFTTAAAMDLLGGDFEFRTTVAARGTVDPQGTLHGDIKITGRGDPTIGGRFHDGNATAVIDEWAAELKKHGIKTIAGDLIFEHGYFDTEYVHPTWPTNQLVNWYEAPVSALSMQEGCVNVRVLPGRPRQRAIVQFEPPNTILNLQNTCITGSGRGIFVTRRLGTNEIIVSGSVPPRAGVSEIFVSIQNPAHYFANVTHQGLKKNGIGVNGQVKLVEREQSPEWRTITEYKTPLSIVNYVINKKSQNQYAEQLLKTIGAEVKHDGSWQAGSSAVMEWLTTKVGVPQGQLQLIDGSGMSRFNRASSDAFITMLRYMWKSPGRREFVSSMPYTGEPESRLRHRLGKPPYARQVFAKTGYIAGVVGLSGYIHAKSGKVYAFSFLFNKYKTGVWGVYRLQDEMLKEVIDNG